MTGQVLALAAIPFLFGLAVGRWWLLLMLALPGTTMFFQAAHAGVPSGPVAVMLVVPLLGAALGITLRRALARLREPSAAR